MEPTTFVFKILSLGSLNHLLPDEKTYLCRPCVAIEKAPKKWGNEYLLIPKKYYEDFLKNRANIFLGAFGKDTKGHINIKIIKHYDAPIRPDYYILVIKHTGERVHKIFDFKKKNESGYSKVLSTAYHQQGSSFICETMLVLQHGDEINLGTLMRFCGKNEKLEEVSKP
jgi:hypothetical protein